MDTLLVICDIMTKFVLLRPMTSKAMNEIAKNLWDVMQSDNGTEFVNELIAELTNLNEIQHTIRGLMGPWNE